VIDDLDRTLEELLKRQLPPAIVNQVAITFAPPSEDFPPASVALPAIDLFLFEIRENRDLRNPVWEVETDSSGHGRRFRPPARVACSYLVTAWPATTSTTPVLDEHRLLSDAMRVLLRFPTLPGPVLRGSLAGAEPPLPSTTIQPGQNQGLTELWHALGGKPRAALTLTVTVAIDLAEPEEAGALVSGREIGIGQTAGNA
jgi:hypothetical protein